MAAEQLKKRTQAFAIAIIKFVQELPDRGPTRIIGDQLVRCGTSVGANFRSSCRARSHLDFIAKLKIVEEESDESIYWLELLEAINPKLMCLTKGLIDEADQILSIIVASIKTARHNSQFVIRNS
jgi:four helix bundle protein